MLEMFPPGIWVGLGGLGVAPLQGGREGGAWVGLGLRRDSGYRIQTALRAGKAAEPILI